MAKPKRKLTAAERRAKRERKRKYMTIFIKEAAMHDSTIVKRLSTAIKQAAKSAKFCVAGVLPIIDPGIEIEGMGKISLPLKRGVGKQLVAACRVAPFGKGSQTLVDKSVRNTFELDPQKFRLSDAWNAAMTAAVRSVAEQLGLAADRLEARLYKLLVYEKGGFFRPHRDSEKHDRMVASMIVVLPNRFDGGKLVVRHGAEQQTYTFDDAAAGRAPCYAAFYADCEHEVQRVGGGIRLCLAYNLVLKPERGKPSAAAKPAAPSIELAQSIGSWVVKQPGNPLVFALDHHYTQRGLSLDLLKGADRQLADLILSAAEKAECFVHLAQVSRHLSQYADDGSFDRGYSRYGRMPRGAIEVGEVYEDELSGSQWADARGEKQPWGEIAFDLSALVSSVPIDDWKPTSEEFEGYTGNAGNTLDRWYHRSAIVVWHRDQHFDVVASAGATESIPLFCSMAARLAKTPKKRLEEARIDCIQFARAIIARWPFRAIGHWQPAKPEKSPCDDFAKHLLTLRDRDSIAMFLTKLAQHDEILQLHSLVLATCREFGWSAFAQELKHLLSSQPNRHGPQEIPYRDVEWLSAFCCDNTDDPNKTALAHELCGLAAARFCEPRPPRPDYYSPHERRTTSVSETSLPLLLKALAASGRDTDLSRAIQFVRESPDDFSLDDCQVPGLKLLIPWSRKRFGFVHPQLASWLDYVRQRLESATARQPAPPADWSRPAEVDCKCQSCAELNAFLADPANEVGRIPAREDLRRHLIGKIDRHQCDVKHVLARMGSPFSLVFTKTRGSFERAVKRFKTDRKLLDELPTGD